MLVKDFRSFLSCHKHFYTLVFLIPLLIWFKYLEFTLAPKYMIHSVLDDRIPFVKEFVVPYIIWFAYIAYGVIYTGIHSRKDFYRLYVFLAAGMTIAFIIYMLYPNAQNLRPEISGSDIFSSMVKYVYDTDTPTNVCPSIHVINTIAVNAALHNSEAFGGKKYGKGISSVLAVLICLSTVFIKQHSILDVFCGIAVSIVLYISIYAVPKSKSHMKYSGWDRDKGSSMDGAE